MTKEQYLKDIIPHEEWLKKHYQYVEESLELLRPYFEVDRFINDYLGRASMVVLRNILVDAYQNYNYDLRELEDNLARLLSIPFVDVVEYRTPKFWEEIADD